MSRLVLLVTSPRVPAGLLSADAWSALRAGPVLTADSQSPQLAALTAAGVAVRMLEPATPVAVIAAQLRDAAVEVGTATWLVGAGGDDGLARLVIDPDAAGAAPWPDVEVEVMHGSWDAPGARLLDVVATMDRLRSPGGCPWDASQDHDSLAPYLLEEAYEAFQAIEDGDLEALREELGDVLLQVVFHARLAEERSADERWSVDDVAAGLVDKLVRRHPHVFADGSARDAAEVETSWDAIKSAERGGASPVRGVPMGAPALTLAASLQRRSARLGVPQEVIAPELAAASGLAAAIGAAASELEQSPSVAAAGALLWTVVAALRELDMDAEAALRGRSRQFRDRLLDIEAAAADDGVDPASLDPVQWLHRWSTDE